MIIYGSPEACVHCSNRPVEECGAGLCSLVTTWGWYGSVCGVCGIAFRAIQGRWEGGQHERWGGLPWQSESPHGLQTVHRITGRRVHFDPMSVPAALSDVTNTYNTSYDTETRSFRRGGDAGQATQRCGGHTRSPGLQVEMRIGGGAFSQMQHQVRTEAGIRGDVMREERSAKVEPSALDGAPNRPRSLVRSDVGQG